MMNKQYYKKFFKILISNLLFLLITFNQNAISKKFTDMKFIDQRGQTSKEIEGMSADFLV